MNQTGSLGAPFCNIAVASDFFAPSAHAVTLATTIARACAAELTLVHVVEPAAYSQIGPDTETLKAVGQRALDAAVVRVRDDLPSARGALLVGRPAEELIAFAEQNGIDLVVSATHGRQSVERWFLGSVAEKVLRACHAPVLTVRAAASPIRKLLVATDFGPSSERAVELAARIAALFGARVTLLHALGDDAGEPDGEVARATRARLEGVAAEMSGVVPAPEVLVRHGKPWSAISDEAKKGYDLVVLGTHGRSAVPRWLIGSVAERVVRSAEPPVLTVRGALT
jgi:nucleotide-binding universal stress UspA family protein